MSENKRVFISWLKNDEGVAGDGKKELALEEYKAKFHLPFQDLLRLASKAVAAGTMEGFPCDGTCNEEGERKTHLHVTPGIRDVKALFDAYQDERPVDLAFAERRLDAAAKYLTNLAKSNPEVEAELSAVRRTLESLVMETGKLKASGAKDYRLITQAIEAATQRAKNAVLLSLAGRAEALISGSGAAEPMQAEARARIVTAVEAGGLEGIAQLVRIVDDWEYMSKRLEGWSKRNREDSAKTVSGRDFRRQRHA